MATLNGGGSIGDGVPAFQPSGVAQVVFYQGIAATGQGFFDDELEHALKLFRANEPDAVICSNDP